MRMSNRPSGAEVARANRGQVGTPIRRLGASQTLQPVERLLRALCESCASALPWLARAAPSTERSLPMDLLRVSAPCGGIRSAARPLLAAIAAIALPAAAHHSLAPYDIEQSIHFDGVVETVRLQNPHIALTLTVTKGDGTRGTINFVEGAPAGRIDQMGL